MSTFDGRVAEFPDIRIDYFRQHVNAHPPLACFLSHVHSDHLAGLEGLRSPFVYCSAATREILLRLERYPCRINYAKGILEARQQTYKHLRKVLKALPLGTPTLLELKPGYQIQVTLFDANHCPGAVMFLIESPNYAIIYTGDIRSEPWFVNSLARNPSLIEYTSGLRTLDKIYLDTSFIRDVPFQTKAEGLAELLRKIKAYPSDTVFHFQAWTYGYEDVWIALSKALKSPIHVDEYKLRIYGSLRIRPSEDRYAAEWHLIPEAPALAGYMCGNAPRPGCLTSEQNVRLHSCEKGNMCAIARHPSVVRIQPIIAHLPNGADMVEVGVGGGGEDLEREAELDFLSREDIDSLLEIICSTSDLAAEKQQEIQTLLAQAAGSGRSVALNLDISSLGDHLSTSLRATIHALAKKPTSTRENGASSSNTLPRVIQFPYSRHSSYEELCALVDLFKPKDVWPCTVDPDEWLRDGITIRTLFGANCSSQAFAHDFQMEALRQQGAGVLVGGAAHIDSQTSWSSGLVPSSPAPCDEEGAAGVQDRVSTNPVAADGHDGSISQMGNRNATADAKRPTQEGCIRDLDTGCVPKRDFGEYSRDADAQADDSQKTDSSVTSSLSFRHSLARREAYFQMLQNATDDDWGPISLISTDGNHTVLDQEL